MKIIYVLGIVLASCLISHAQIGVDNASPDPSAVLDLTATDKGLLVPRMTTAQRLAIANPAASLMVFDVTVQEFFYYKNSQWYSMTGSGVFPSGGIIMWSGPINAIPTGWALCDGGGNRPDLRDKFIVGAGSSYSIGQTGGANTVKLTADQSGLRSHSHAVTDPGHSHTYNQATTKLPQSGSSTQVFTANTSSTTSTSTTGVTINAVGAQDATVAHENRPPYFALAYIIKL